MSQKELFRLSIGGFVLEHHLLHGHNSMRHSWAANRHSNIDYELFLILKGTCSVEVDGTVHSLHEKQGILILPGHYHKPISHSADLDMLAFNFALKKGELPANDFHGCAVFDLTELTVALALEHLDEWDGLAPYSRQMVHSRIEQLMLRCFRSMGLLKPDAGRALSDDWRTDIIDGFFANNLSESVTKQDLAASLHLSGRQVNRVLERHYGMSFRLALLRARMEHAAWLLSTTDLTLPDIAAKVGYASAPSFIRSFTQYHGMPPRQFSAQNHKKKKTAP